MRCIVNSLPNLATVPLRILRSRVSNIASMFFPGSFRCHWTAFFAWGRCGRLFCVASLKYSIPTRAASTPRLPVGVWGYVGTSVDGRKGRAYDNICMDERPKQLIGEMRRPIPAQPGQPERYDTKYICNGTCNLFVFTAPLIDWRRAKVTERRTLVAWVHQVRRLVDDDSPNVDKVVLVMDNRNTHRPASLYEAFEPAKSKRITGRLRRAGDVV